MDVDPILAKKNVLWLLNFIGFLWYSCCTQDFPFKCYIPNRGENAKFVLDLLLQSWNPFMDTMTRWIKFANKIMKLGETPVNTLIAFLLVYLPFFQLLSFWPKVDVRSQELVCSWTTPQCESSQVTSLAKSKCHFIFRQLFCEKL